MRPIAVNNSHQYLKFIHFQLFSYALTHSTCSNTTRTTIIIIIFIYIHDTCTTISTKTTSNTKTTTSIFIFICICGTSNTSTTRTGTSIFIFICTCGISTLTNTKTTSSTRTSTSIFIFIYIRGISINTSIFIFISIRSTSISASTFATPLITKLAYTVLCSQRVRIMICPSILYLSSILSYSSVIKILRHLSLASWTNVVGRIKTIFFRIIFNQSINNWFKILYLKHKFNCRTTLCIIKLRVSS